MSNVTEQPYTLITKSIYGIWLLGDYWNLEPWRMEDGVLEEKE